MHTALRLPSTIFYRTRVAVRIRSAQPFHFDIDCIQFGCISTWAIQNWAKRSVNRCEVNILESARTPTTSDPICRQS